MGRRRLSIAFGLQSAVADMEYVSNATNAPVIVDYPGVGGAQAARTTLVNAQSTGFNVSHGALDVFGLRWRYRVGTAPTALNTILRVSGAAVFVRVKIDNNRKLELSDEDGVIGTSAAAFGALDSDHDIGLLFDRSGAPGAHIIRLYVDDVEVVGSGTRDISGTPNVLEFGSNRNAESQTVGNWYFTNIAINDNTGSEESQVPAAGYYMAYAFPVANGDANVGAMRGGADSGADWSQMDEVPPNDGTDYMELNSTTSVVWAKVPTAAALGIGGAYIIKLVQVGGRIALASAGAGNWFPSIKSQSGGAVLDGSPVTLASAAYSTNDDSSGLKQYKLTSYTDPQTGGAWTAAKIDTMQIGAKTTDGAPATRVTGLWAIIEYKPFNVNIPSVLSGGLYAGLAIPQGGLQ